MKLFWLRRAVVLAVLAGINDVALRRAASPEPLGTLVNVIWAAYGLLALSVLVKAARSQGFEEERSGT
jgi:hypothetical protein